ncbi:MAG: endolytic transglycosylase MltG [Acidimicrobiales bacterium]|nr:endolytic transglycosylase MltG [Acidimicrobiales bacterium]
MTGGVPDGPRSDPATEPGTEPATGLATEAPSGGRSHGEGTEPAGVAPSGRRWLRHPWRIAALVFLLLGLGVIVGGYLWVDSQANPSGPPGAQVIVTVGPGSGVNQLAGTLASKGVIGSSLAYRIWSQVHRVPGVQAGAYAFNKNTSFSAVDNVISAGPNVFPVVVPPGFTVAEVAQRVGQLPGHSAAGFSAVATGGALHSPWQPAGSNNLDGLLGTGTYVIVPGESDSQLLTKMIDRFDAEAGALGLASGSAQLGLTPYQVITVASIVQKEGVIAKNLGPVARVVLNRLQRDMPLQMDSTVLYSEGRDGGPVTTKDLQLVSPYNTYLNKGLTPTPICFPSRASLQAALNPPAGTWLYFVVVQSDGTEAFADTFSQQQSNEALAKQRGLA